MSKWINQKVISCGRILRLGANVTECQCPKCKRWCIKWADAFDYKNCPHCGAEMKGGAK